MSLLLPDSGLLFWMFLSFGIVFVILAKYGFPVIIKMVEGRKTYIDQSLEVAREANAQLSRLKEEGDAWVAAANKEQGRILREAMEERDKIVHEARKQAEIAAQKELDAVKQQIQIEKDEAIRDIRRQVAVLSVDIAEKVLRKNLADKEAQMGKKEWKTGYIRNSSLCLTVFVHNPDCVRHLIIRSLRLRRN